MDLHKENTRLTTQTSWVQISSKDHLATVLCVRCPVAINLLTGDAEKTVIKASRLTTTKPEGSIRDKLSIIHSKAVAKRFVIITAWNSHILTLKVIPDKLLPKFLNIQDSIEKCITPAPIKIALQGLNQSWIEWEIVSNLWNACVVFFHYFSLPSLVFSFIILWILATEKRLNH